VDVVEDARPSLRPVRDDDRRFLLELYGTARAAELALVAWDDAAKAAFVEQQFNAQDAHYRRYYEGASFDVVEVGGHAAGRLYVQRGQRDIRVIDILLAPAFRGRGIGGLLLGELAAEAQAGGRVLSIHVEPQNPARRLYERLGLRPVAEHGLYVLMELEAPAQDQVKTAS
jgi:ribosomal protein S18 acetylase RimI-like enzyme